MERENDKKFACLYRSDKKTYQSLHLLLLIFVVETNAVPSMPIIFES